MMILLVAFVLALQVPFVRGQCTVDDIQMKEDFNPYHFEGKWYLISMTRLWGINFSPQNFTNSTGRTSWGDNANKFFGRWNKNNNGSSWWSNRRRNKNGGMNRGRGGDSWAEANQEQPFTRSTTGNPKEKTMDREGWLRKSDETAVPTRNSTDWPMKFPGGNRGVSPNEGDGSGDPQNARFGNRTRNGSWTQVSDRYPARGTTPSERRQKGWSRPMGRMSKGFKEVFDPKNFQMETYVRDDSNIDMFIVAEFFGRCIFTKGQGSIVNPRNTAKIEVNFPVRWFLPCQPFWIVDTDYEGYSVVYFCLEILADGTCDPESATVWTFNRKLTGHTKKETDQVNAALERLCVDEADLTVMSQTEYCPIEDENVQDQKNSKPTIHCNNADQQTLRITLDSPYSSESFGNNVYSFSPALFPSPAITFIALIVCFVLGKQHKTMILNNSV
ncbi:uncharacterized protein [Argopecten irradians]|uniref:uncharacterized protein n=1 Tax=Argopecten irradians TaxID=31199 RepID=UPI003716B401